MCSNDLKTYQMDGGSIFSVRGWISKPVFATILTSINIIDNVYQIIVSYNSVESNDYSRITFNMLSIWELTKIKLTVTYLLEKGTPIPVFCGEVTESKIGSIHNLKTYTMAKDSIFSLKRWTGYQDIGIKSTSSSEGQYKIMISYDLGDENSDCGVNHLSTPVVFDTMNVDEFCKVNHLVEYFLERGERVPFPILN
jgi:hypothetical protein